MFDCLICYESCSIEDKVSCPKCQQYSCKNCVKKHLKGIEGTERCFNPMCNMEWNRVFCVENINLSFVNNYLRKKKESFLLDREKARIPDLLPKIKAYARMKKLEKQIKTQYNTLTSQKVAQLRREINKCRTELSLSDKKKEKKEKKDVVRKCPADKCNGFLFEWKCTICETLVCKKCFEIKEKDHKCLEANIETAKMLRKETKSCPKCAVPIYKISGCDQMWCTVCNVAFSWRTGNIVTGIIHNPHYYEWKRNGGGEIRNPGDNVCGGLIGYNKLNEVFTKLKTKSCVANHEFINFLKDRVNNSHRFMGHTMDVTINPLRRVCQRNDELPEIEIIKFAAGVTTSNDSRMKRQLFLKDKEKEFNLAKLHLYEMLNTLMIEILNSISKSKDIYELLANITQMEKLRIYFNKEFTKIGYIYTRTIYTISYTWETGYGVRRHVSGRVPSKSECREELERDYLLYFGLSMDGNHKMYKNTDSLKPEMLLKSGYFN